MESSATPRCPVGSVSSGISSVMTLGGDRVVEIDTEHVKKDGSDASRGTKGTPRRWVVISHVDEVHMTRPIGLVVEKKRVG